MLVERFRLADLALAASVSPHVVKNCVAQALAPPQGDDAQGWRSFSFSELVLVCLDAHLRSLRTPRGLRQAFRKTAKQEAFLQQTTVVLDNMTRAYTPVYLAIDLPEGPTLWVTDNRDYERRVHTGSVALYSMWPILREILANLAPYHPSLPKLASAAYASPEAPALTAAEQALLNRLRDSRGPLVTQVKSQDGKIVSITDIAASDISW